MQLMHIKLRNHEDLLTFVERSKHDNRILVLTQPISVHLDPDRGFYAKHWLVFSENNYVNLPSDSVLFINKASKSAEDYYEEFFKKTKKNAAEESYEEEEDLEEMFTSMLESKTSTKH
jgi:hypothetical protein